MKVLGYTDEVTTCDCCGKKNLKGSFCIETDMTITNPREYVKQAAELDRAELVDAITTKFNCHEADVDTDGDVWIASPQTGHWLDDDGLAELVEWIEAQ